MASPVWFASETGGQGIWALSESAAALTITDINPGETDAVVTWTGGTATHYRIDGGAATAMPDGTSPDTITGLTANTEYNSPGLELSADGGSTWSTPVAFGTDNPGSGGGSGEPPLGQASETDTALTLAAPRQARSIGQATEADAAQALTSRQSAAIGQASETDSALAAAASLPGSIGIAAEADAAQALQSRLSTAIGQAAEANLAQPVTLGGTAGTLGQAQEANAAQAFVAHLLAGIAQASETDAALGFTPTTVRTIAQAQEGDAALALASRQLAALGIAVEFNLAQRVTYPGQDDALSAFWRYDIPGLSLRYDVPGLSLRYDVPSIGAAFTVA